MVTGYNNRFINQLHVKQQLVNYIYKRIEVSKFKYKILEYTNDLKLLPDATSEITQVGSMTVYKSRVPPHHLLLLFSSDPNAMLETKNLREIEETIHLFSNQLVTMLQSIEKVSG